MVGGIKKNTSEALSREADIDPTSSSYYASPSVLDQYNIFQSMYAMEEEHILHI